MLNDQTRHCNSSHIRLLLTDSQQFASLQHRWLSCAILAGRSSLSAHTASSLPQTYQEPHSTLGVIHLNSALLIAPLAMTASTSFSGHSVINSLRQGLIYYSCLTPSIKLLIQRNKVWKRKLLSASVLWGIRDDLLSSKALVNSWRYSRCDAPGRRIELIQSSRSLPRTGEIRGSLGLLCVRASVYWLVNSIIILVALSH